MRLIVRGRVVQYRGSSYRWLSAVLMKEQINTIVLSNIFWHYSFFFRYYQRYKITLLFCAIKVIFLHFSGTVMYVINNNFVMGIYFVSLRLFSTTFVVQYRTSLTKYFSRLNFLNRKMSEFKGKERKAALKTNCSKRK